MTIKKNFLLPLVASLGLALTCVPVFAQESLAPATSVNALAHVPDDVWTQEQSSSSTSTQQQQTQQQEPGPAPKLGQTSKLEQSTAQTPPSKQQTKRILWVLPNFASVSADANVPPLDAKGKFKLFLNDSFDYSTFIYVGALAGIGLAADNVPQFQQGAAGYGRYY